MLAATRSGRQHWASLMRLDPSDLSWSLQRTPAGEPWVWIPCPGGHEKFDLLYDKPSSRYWLAGSRGLPGLPLGREVSQEAGLHRIGLWSSANLVDWQFSSEIAAGEEGPSGIRCDPSSAISGNDWVWVCRAGGAACRNARELRQILCGRLVDFRSKPS